MQVQHDVEGTAISRPSARHIQSQRQQGRVREGLGYRVQGLGFRVAVAVPAQQLQPQPRRQEHKIPEALTYMLQGGPQAWVRGEQSANQSPQAGAKGPW